MDSLAVLDDSPAVFVVLKIPDVGYGSYVLASAIKLGLQLKARLKNQVRDRTGLLSKPQDAIPRTLFLAGEADTIYYYRA